MLGRRAGSDVGKYEYYAESPKQGSPRLNFITKTIHFAHQGILLTYLWTPAPDTVIGIPIYVIHHNPTYWPEPEQFRPERFLKASLTIYVHRTSKIQKNKYNFVCFPDQNIRDGMVW